MRFNRITAVLLLSVIGLSTLTGCTSDRNRRNRRRVETPLSRHRVSTIAWPLTSNLPIVILDTSGRWIPDEPKIPANLTIIHDKSGGRNSVTHPNVHFEGKIGVEIRGKTSQGFPKRQYGFEIHGDNGEAVERSLLGMPAESDWILHGPYSDKTLMRNFLAYHFSNRIGRYAARTKFVELLLNDTGDPEIRAHHYVGVYLLMEKIKRDKNRVDIRSLSPSQNSELEISGGYILKIDKMDHYDSYFITNFRTHLIHVYPKGSRITDAQRAWIRDYMSDFEAALVREEGGYAKYIDTDAFIDHFIINEVFRNIDGFRLSTYMYKDRGGLLTMGPVWDFNLSMGNANYYQGWKPEGWLLDTIPVPFWWDSLLSDPNFKRRLVTRWKVLRKDELATASVTETIDQTAEYLAEAQARNFQRWQVLGQYVWPNPSPYPRTYSAEVSGLKRWLEKRLEWMDGEMERLRR